MNTIALNQSIFTVSIPTIDTKKFRQFVKLMGWTAKAVPTPTQLYDPESGEYVNEKTMRVIEDARQGKGIAFRGSIDEFKTWADAL